MARLFSDESTQILTATTAAASGTPCTMVAWFYPDEATKGQIICLDTNGAGGDTLNTYMDGDQKHVAQHYDGTSSLAKGGALATLNAWNHIAGVFASDSARSSFLNGGDKATNTDARTAVTVDSTTFAHIDFASPVNLFSGRIAEGAIWDVALTDAEVATLAQGFSPLFIRPQNLVFYAPLFRDEDFDKVGGLTLTPSGSPTVAEHPPIIYPAPQFYIMAPPAAGGVTVTVLVASLALTGYVPTVQTPVAVTVPVASLALTGFTPTVTVTKNVSVEVPVASLALTGFAPMVTATANISITVPVASLALAGFAPTVTTTANVSVTIPVASLTLAGYAPTVTATADISIEIPSNVLSLTGYIPSITVSGGFSVVVPAGALILTGFAPNVTPPEEPIVLIGAAALHGSHHLDEDDGRKEMLKFWQEYYQNVLKLTQAQARMRAEEMVQASLQDELDLIDLTLL